MISSILGLSLHQVKLLGPEWAKHRLGKYRLAEKTKNFGLHLVSLGMLRNSIQKSIGSKLHENRMSAMTDAIDHSLPQNKYISKIFATPSAYPVQILDIRGREASGLIICLMLMLLGVDREHILRDYM